MADDGDSLAILPRSMGDPRQREQQLNQRPDPKKFIPQQKGGLLLEKPEEQDCPYTFSDSPAYLRKKEAEQQAKRAAELESKDETRGFLRSVEELGKKHKWEEAHQLLERRTAVPSGLFLITRAMLRWKFFKYQAALKDVEDALKDYGSSAKAGPFAAAFASFARICIGSEARDKGSCSKEMKGLVAAWEDAEQQVLQKHVLGSGLFQPQEVARLTEPTMVADGIEAHDGSYVAASGIRIGYVFMKNKRDASAPVVVHFHGTKETAADYRGQALAEKYRDLNVHLLVVDYRGYGWSGGVPSLATFLRDAEPLAEKLPEILVEQGFAWPYPGGVVVSGRSLGAQVAVHLAALFPHLFRALLLDSALATSATGDRLGRAHERAAALECWRKELEKANLDVLVPLDADLWGLSAMDKIRGYDGQLLVIHGQQDDIVPYEGSESLHVAAASRQKELVLIDNAGHNDIGHFDSYWSAQRRFLLKVQLDDSLPSVGPTVEHLCAICAGKAASKCGRCQKVWYCGRAHQVEHWKAHKLTCAGGPPDPKPKVQPEGDACVAAIVVAEVNTIEDLDALRACLESACAQEPPLQSLFVSWFGSSEEMLTEVARDIEDVRSSNSSVEIVAAQAPKAQSQFEHIRDMVEKIAPSAPPHLWVTFLDLRGIWSQRYVQTLLPALRRAAADQRVLAVSCPRCVRLKPTGTLVADSDSSTRRSVADVSAALASGKLDDFDVSTEASDLEMVDLSIRFKTLQAFVEATPAPALAHEFCAHRFRYRLSNTFGKKFQVHTPTDDDWMRFEGASLSACSTASAGNLTDVDRQRGKYIFEGTQTMRTDTSAGEAVEVGNFTNLEEAECALANLRRSVERRLIVNAGETMTSEDLKAIGADQMKAFLERAGLDKVIGIQRWARETASDILDVASEAFSISITGR